MAHYFVKTSATHSSYQQVRFVCVAQFFRVLHSYTKPFVGSVRLMYMAYFETKFSASHSPYWRVRLICDAQIYFQTTLIYKTLSKICIVFWISYSMVPEKIKLHSRTKSLVGVGINAVEEFIR